MTDSEKTIIDLAAEHMATPPESNATPSEQPQPEPQPETPRKRSQGKEAPRKSADKPVEDILAGLLKEKSNTTSVLVDLPSGGKAYHEHAGHVNISPFTYADEKHLRGVTNMSGAQKAIGTIFDRCVEGLSYEESTIPDKNYLLFKLREISYGDDYPITLNCDTCGANNMLKLKISSIPVNTAKEDLEDPIKVTLPDTEQEVEIRLPRSRDESYMENLGSITNNLWRFVISVGGYTDGVVVRKFIEQTSVRDVDVMRATVLNVDYGLDQKMSYHCLECGHLNKGMIPLNENFFSAS